jgi:hypothetical protein
VRRCVEKLTFIKVALTFDLDLWRQSILDAELFSKTFGLWNFIISSFYLQKVIDMCLKRIIKKKMEASDFKTLFETAI